MSLLDVSSGIKKCSNPQCKEVDPAAFHKALTWKDGLQLYCKACVKERSRKYYKANREAIKARNAAWEKANPEKVAAKKKRLRGTSVKIKASTEAYRDKANDNVRRWYYRPGNKEKARAGADKWIAANPEKKLAQVHRRRAAKESLPVLYSGLLWNECLVVFECLCAYCGKGETLLEQDHFIPLSGRLLPAEMERPGHVPWNIVPACTPCNRGKLHRDPFVWLKKAGHMDSLPRILEYIEMMKRQYRVAA